MRNVGNPPPIVPHTAYYFTICSLAVSKLLLLFPERASATEIVHRIQVIFFFQKISILHINGRFSGLDHLEILMLASYFPLKSLAFEAPSPPT